MPKTTRKKCTGCSLSVTEFQSTAETTRVRVGSKLTVGVSVRVWVSLRG